MGTLVLSAEQHLGVRPEEVFALFGQGERAGWLFHARCDRLVVGSAVTLTAPIGGEVGVDLLGRISALAPPGRIEIVHDQPWRGKIRLTIDRHGEGSRVRLRAELDNEGLDWLIRLRGHQSPDPLSADEHRIGVMTSKSGPGSVFSAATSYLAAMAVDEINADGGIGGRMARLLVGDDATDPGKAVVEARRLVQAGCRVIVANTTSASFNAMATALQSTGLLLVHSLMNEGGGSGELVFRLGERPGAQLEAAVAPIMKQSGGRRWYLAGNDYCWPRVVSGVAHRVVNHHGGTVAGMAYAPLGTTDFTPIIEQILASSAELVLSTFVGADLVAFERQCYAMGVRDHARTLALALDEPTVERIGVDAAAGSYGVAGYFAALGNEQNIALLKDYRSEFGRWAPPVSSVAESVYEAISLYAGAARRAASDSPRDVARSLRSGRFHFPRGEVNIENPNSMQQDLYLAQVSDGQFSIQQTIGS